MTVSFKDFIKIFCDPEKFEKYFGPNSKRPPEIDLQDPKVQAFLREQGYMVDEEGKVVKISG